MPILRLLQSLAGENHGEQDRRNCDEQRAKCGRGLVGGAVPTQRIPGSYDLNGINPIVRFR